MAANLHPSSIILICYSDLHLQFHFRRCNLAGACIQISRLGLTLGDFQTRSRRLRTFLYERETSRQLNAALNGAAT